MAKYKFKSGVHIITFLLLALLTGLFCLAIFCMFIPKIN